MSGTLRQIEVVVTPGSAPGPRQPLEPHGRQDSADACRNSDGCDKGSKEQQEETYPRRLREPIDSRPQKSETSCGDNAGSEHGDHDRHGQGVVAPRRGQRLVEHVRLQVLGSSDAMDTEGAQWSLGRRRITMIGRDYDDRRFVMGYF